MKNIFVLLYFSLAFSFFGGAGEGERLHQFIDPALLQDEGVQLFAYTTRQDKEYRVGAVLIDAEPEMIWNILQDMETLGSDVPYLDYQKIRKKDEDGRTGEMLVEGRFNIPHFTAQYTITMSFDRPRKWREWRILTPEEVDSYRRKGTHVLRTSGLIRNMEGFEYLEATDAGAKTIYYYALDIQSTIPLPEFVKKSLSEPLLVQHLRFIRDRAESQQQKGDNRGTDIKPDL
ncbi:MAG TPA: hypothetical protein PKY89_10565 [Deltaproteobacteria bacterium]|nr:hypothetical protein [Deltaproteobacteria bacterium]HPJ94338.1 hypothetical protein [Deltaproteobacteria bacterium]